MTSVTSQLVERLIATDFRALPAEAVDMAKQVCLDGIAVMIAGAGEPLGVGRITLDYTRDLGGTPEASVVCGGFKTSALNAAYANGTLCHALDFDNTSVPVNHPTSASLPAILAIAEREKLSGRDVVAALVLAFEVQGRMRLATRAIGANSIFHKPGVSGLMGAVTGAGKLVKLGQEPFCCAFGIAGSRAGSITVNTGTMTKSSHAGHGARVEALLARTHVDLRKDIPSDIGTTYTVVRVRMADGRSLEARCDVPRGFPGVPLSREERVAKFYDCIVETLPPAASERLLNEIERLEDLATVASIMEIASSARALTPP